MKKRKLSLFVYRSFDLFFLANLFSLSNALGVNSRFTKISPFSRTFLLDNRYNFSTPPYSKVKTYRHTLRPSWNAFLSYKGGLLTNNLLNNNTLILKKLALTKTITLANKRFSTKRNVFEQQKLLLRNYLLGLRKVADENNRTKKLILSELFDIFKIKRKDFFFLNSTKTFHFAGLVDFFFGDFNFSFAPSYWFAAGYPYTNVSGLNAYPFFTQALFQRFYYLFFLDFRFNLFLLVEYPFAEFFNNKHPSSASVRALVFRKPLMLPENDLVDFQLTSLPSIKVTFLFYILFIEKFCLEANLVYLIEKLNQSEALLQNQQVLAITFGGRGLKKFKFFGEQNGEVSDVFEQQYKRPISFFWTVLNIFKLKFSRYLIFFVLSPKVQIKPRAYSYKAAAKGLHLLGELGLRITPSALSKKKRRKVALFFAGKPVRLTSKKDGAKSFWYNNESRPYFLYSYLVFIAFCCSPFLIRVYLTFRTSLSVLYFNSELKRFFLTFIAAINKVSFAIVLYFFQKNIIFTEILTLTNFVTRLSDFLFFLRFFIRAFVYITRLFIKSFSIINFFYIFFWETLFYFFLICGLFIFTYSWFWVTVFIAIASLVFVFSGLGHTVFIERHMAVLRQDSIFPILNFFNYALLEDKQVFVSWLTSRVFFFFKTFLNTKFYCALLVLLQIFFFFKVKAFASTNFYWFSFWRNLWALRLASKLRPLFATSNASLMTKINVFELCVIRVTKKFVWQKNFKYFFVKFASFLKTKISLGRLFWLYQDFWFNLTGHLGWWHHPTLIAVTQLRFSTKLYDKLNFLLKNRGSVVSYLRDDKANLNFISDFSQLFINLLNKRLFFGFNLIKSEEKPFYFLAAVDRSINVSFNVLLFLATKDAYKPSDVWFVHAFFKKTWIVLVIFFWLFTLFTLFFGLLRFFLKLL